MGAWCSSSKVLNEKGKVDEGSVRGMSIDQLVDLGKEIDLHFYQDLSKEERQKQIILRLEWLGKRSIVKANATSAWIPPDVNLGKTHDAHVVSVNSTIHIQPENNVPMSGNLSQESCLSTVIQALKAENSKLMASLKKSESLRMGIEKKLNHFSK